MYVNFLSTYSDKKSCHTSTTLQTSIARFVSDIAELLVPYGSRRSIGVPSGRIVFLRLLVGELGPPNLPIFTPISNGYTHTECYYTVHQIWTKDV